MASEQVLAWTFPGKATCRIWLAPPLFGLPSLLALTGGPAPPTPGPCAPTLTIASFEKPFKLYCARPFSLMSRSRSHTNNPRDFLV